MASEKLSVLGAGGHGKVVIGTAEAAGYEIGAVYDDREELWGRDLLGYRIEGPIEAADPNERRAVIAVGSNAARRDLAARIECQWATVVHPSVQLHHAVAIEAGTVVFAGAVLQPDTMIGRHVIINTGATLDHDCAISDLAHVGPGAHLAGNVQIGEGSFVGIGVAIMPGLSTGTWSVVGAGAAVTEDVPAGASVVGVPAKPLES